LRLYCSINLLRIATGNVRQVHLVGYGVPHAAQVRFHGRELLWEAFGHARCERLEVRHAVVLIRLYELCDRPDALLEYVGVELRRIK
jgi:hypothetical protein